MKRVLAICHLALLASAFSTHAQQTDPSVLLNAEYQRAIQELSNTYKQLPYPPKQALRNWECYRQAQSALEGTLATNSTTASVLELECKIALTREWTTRLKTYSDYEPIKQKGFNSYSMRDIDSEDVSYLLATFESNRHVRLQPGVYNLSSEAGEKKSSIRWLKTFTGASYPAFFEIKNLSMEGVSPIEVTLTADFGCPTLLFENCSDLVLRNLSIGIGADASNNPHLAALISHINPTLDDTNDDAQNLSQANTISLAGAVCFRNCENIRLINCKIQSPLNGLILENCKDVTLERCAIWDCPGQLFLASNSQEITLDRCRIRRTTGVLTSRNSTVTVTDTKVFDYATTSQPLLDLDEASKVSFKHCLLPLENISPPNPAGHAQIEACTEDDLDPYRETDAVIHTDPERFYHYPGHPQRGQAFVIDPYEDQMAVVLKYEGYWEENEDGKYEYYYCGSVNAPHTLYRKVGKALVEEGDLFGFDCHMQWENDQLVYSSQSKAGGGVYHRHTHSWRKRTMNAQHFTPLSYERLLESRSEATLELKALRHKQLTEYLQCKYSRSRAKELKNAQTAWNSYRKSLASYESEEKISITEKNLRRNQLYATLYDQYAKRLAPFLALGQFSTTPPAPQHEVTVDSIEALADAVAPNTCIYLSPGSYWSDLKKGMLKENDFINENATVLVFSNLSNFSLKGAEENNVNILTSCTGCAVLYFENCTDLTLGNLTLGHATQGYCGAPVVSFESCNNVRVENCDLFGCGEVGLSLTETRQFLFENSIIRECSNGLAYIRYSSDLFFFQSQFFDNQFRESLIPPETTSPLSFIDCTFSHNHKPSSSISSQRSITKQYASDASALLCRFVNDDQATDILSQGGSITMKACITDPRPFLSPIDPSACEGTEVSLPDLFLNPSKLSTPRD